MAKMEIEVYSGYITKNFSYHEMIKSSTAARYEVFQTMHQGSTLLIWLISANFILQPVREDPFGAYSH